MSITHTFVDFIPSIFLGAPDEDSVLSVLPGHQFLLKGHGHQALVLTLKGGLIAMILILLFTPIFINFLPEFYETISKLIPCILIGISMISIATKKKKYFRR
jgi:putative membrane protein